MPKKHDYLVGLDLGSHRTRCVVALEENSRLRFISYGLAASAGWSRGVIVDQDQALASVEKAVAQAEDNGGLLVEAAVVGVGGSHVGSQVARGDLELNSWERQIEQRHVDAAVKNAATGRLSNDRALLQAVPLEFTVDGQPGHRKPQGVSGRRLEAHVRLISASAQAHNSIQAVVNRAGVVVEETIFEPFAASHAVLDGREREMGIAVADMGAASIELVGYLENGLELAESIPIGGDHFVNDVATLMRLQAPQAERLIEQYGCAVLDGEPRPNVMIEVPGASGETTEPKSRKMLAEILQARAEEVFELIHQRVRYAGLDGRLIGGLVLTGGLALLAGICDVAEEQLDTSTRIGLPPSLEDLPDELDHPAWATAIGLLLYSQRLRLHQQRRRDRVADWLKTIFD